MKNKNKVFVGGKLLPNSPPIAWEYVNPNANLILELSEKEAIKYLMMSDNDFSKMVEDLVIVMNNKIKIENIDK